MLIPILFSGAVFIWGESVTGGSKRRFHPITFKFIAFPTIVRLQMVYVGISRSSDTIGRERKGSEQKLFSGRVFFSSFPLIRQRCLKSVSRAITIPVIVGFSSSPVPYPRRRQPRTDPLRVKINVSPFSIFWGHVFLIKTKPRCQKVTRHVFLKSRSSIVRRLSRLQVLRHGKGGFLVTPWG